MKQLQRELAKLENELRNVSSVSASGGDSASALREKELLIQKVNEKSFTYYIYLVLANHLMLVLNSADGQRNQGIDPSTRFSAVPC